MNRIQVVQLRKQSRNLRDMVEEMEQLYLQDQEDGIEISEEKFEEKQEEIADQVETVASIATAITKSGDRIEIPGHVPFDIPGRKPDMEAASEKGKEMAEIPEELEGETTEENDYEDGFLVEDEE